MKSASTKLLVAIGTVLLAGLAAGIFLRSSRSDFILAMQQDAALRIEGIKLYNAVTSKYVLITNADSLDYLTRQFKTATGGFDAGEVCRANVVLSSGWKLDVKVVIAEGGRDVSIGERQGTFKDERFYKIKLTEPIPKDVTEALAVMTTAGYVR